MTEPRCSDSPGATHHMGCQCHEAARNAEIARLNLRTAELEEKLGRAKETIAHYTCAGCQPEAKGVFCYQYRACKDLAILNADKTTPKSVK